MATVKIATLLIRTIAKPIATQIKHQAKEHERFRSVCVNLAQMMNRTEIKLRTNMLGGEPAKHVRPLSETRAIENGANALAEGFLFAVAAAMILGEGWRSSRNQSKRRVSVDDQLEDLGTKVEELTTRVDTLTTTLEERLLEEKQRSDELGRILERVVEIGLRGGWAEFEGTPLQLPLVQLAPRPPQQESIPPSSPSTPDTQIDPDTQNKSKPPSDRNK